VIDRNKLRRIQIVRARIWNVCKKVIKMACGHRLKLNRSETFISSQKVNHLYPVHLMRLFHEQTEKSIDFGVESS